MKINSDNRIIDFSLYADRLRGKTAREEAKGSTAGAGCDDSVSISSAAREISRVNSKKVEELKAEVADGTYHVDPVKVAEALIKDAITKGPAGD